MRDVFNWQL